jgi:hypothetical protein
MARRIKILVVEPAPSEENPDQWAIESLGVDRDLGGEESVARTEFGSEQEARINASMIMRQMQGRPPAFSSTYDQETGRTVYTRDI